MKAEPKAPLLGRPAATDAIMSSADTCTGSGSDTMIQDFTFLF